MAKLAKDMTDDEFDTYYKQIMNKIEECIPDDFVWIAGLWAKDGKGEGGMDGNLNKAATIIVLKKVINDLTIQHIAKNN
jgi:hypothetical protein